MERRTITVQGIVQGVGFRPFVHRLASRLRLGGFVKNFAGGVLIEIEGEEDSLDRFLAHLESDRPCQAHIDGLQWQEQAPRGYEGFSIQASGPGGGADPLSAGKRVVISPDLATCEACLAELYDPADRRYLYPFLNCTNCGPRLTVITSAPYDRQRTTMAGFAMCAPCRAEYDDPANRRFHAQPTACPDCGPRLRLLDGSGRPLQTGPPLPLFAASLRAGRIGAMKGLGGYHLACDGRNEAAVHELRRRKHRDEKPLAVMVRGPADARLLCSMLPEEEALLVSPRRPIVLLRKRGSAEIAANVAPRNPLLGVMLPYTPLHHVLLEALAGIPLVMTSGNQSDEPIAYQDDDAIERLAGIADLILAHDRPIHVRCEDSVTRFAGSCESPIRRSRGYAPQPLCLPVECPCPVLAVGGQFKATFALGRGRDAFVSHHLGDLEHYEAQRALAHDVALYEQLFSIRPNVVAHDLHPDYASTQYALSRAEREPDAALAGVQHHHAHMASCMAEHDLDETVIGVTFDGAGLGTDGTIWGGEFLIGDYGWFRRAAHLRPVGMPGGDRAVREPWRMAAAQLIDSGCGLALLAPRLSPAALGTAERMLERRFNTPLTSSAGRLFDAVAALVGVRDDASYEGQAAMELEWLATPRPRDAYYPFEIAQPQHRPGAAEPDPLIVDVRPLIRSIVGEVRRNVDAATISRRFHSTVAEIIAAVCVRLRRATGVDAAVLSGGVFMNALLAEEASARLDDEGFRVYRHRLVPCNDGGLSLGQLAVAAGRLRQKPSGDDRHVSWNSW